ncbi:DUF2087 domain-containing protein [Microbacterium sp. PA5]|uniref:DUF2087 domain-containing protein n=1 Tax=Microbacterium sp. PA5 TaxID=3416654 RepID=UPI003CF92BAD
MGRSRIRIELVPDGEDFPEARAWRLETDGRDVGRLRAARADGDVSIHVEVAPDARRRGVARVAVGRVLGMAPWGAEVRYVAVLAPDDLAGAALARALGFRESDVPQGAAADDADDADDRAGRRLWVRPAPRPRAAADDIARFLDASGRIDRYPLRAADRGELLQWVAARALPAGVVLAERRVNELLAPYAPGEDVAALRRHLVDHGLVDRTASGSEYVRTV